MLYKHSLSTKINNKYVDPWKQTRIAMSYKICFKKTLKDLPVCENADWFIKYSLTILLPFSDMDDFLFR